VWRLSPELQNDHFGEQITVEALFHDKDSRFFQSIWQIVRFVGPALLSLTYGGKCMANCHRRKRSWWEWITDSIGWIARLIVTQIIRCLLNGENPFGE